MPAVQLRHLVGAAAGGVLLGVLQAPRVLFGGVLLDQLGIVDRRHDHREIGDREPVLRDEVDADGVVVDDDELLGLGRASPRPSGRSGSRRRVTARSSDHFTSLAVTGVPSWKVGVLLQLEGGGHVADVHVVGELHLELVAVVVRHAVRTVFISWLMRRS